MDIVVQHAELHAGPTRRGKWRIALDITDDKGETVRRLTFMPADAIEWRVAQFNVDPRAALEMLLVGGNTAQDEEALILATTRSEARARRLATVQRGLAGGAVRGAVGPPEWGTSLEADKALATSGDADDPIETILQYSPVDDELVTAKREVLDEVRSRFRRRRANKVARAAARDAATKSTARGVPADPLAGLERPTPEQLKRHLLPTTFDGHAPARGRRNDE